MPDNLDRASWARTALDVFAHETYNGRSFDQLGGDKQDCIADLIADCLHLAQQEGLDPAEAIRTAQNNFDYELEHPDEG